MSETLTREAFEDGVREDGTVEDQMFETFYCEVESVSADERGYLRIVGDHGTYNVEIRVPFATLEGAGWKRPGAA